MPLDHPNLAEAPPSGPTLRQRVEKGGPLPTEQALRLGVELARALAHLHASGRLEAGVSPDSVVLTPEGRAVLVTGRNAPDGESGLVPFEREAGRPQAASDLYQLGGTLLFALTGSEPKALGLPTELDAKPLGGLQGPLRESLCALLDPRWERRPATALAAAEELDCLARGEPTPRQARRRRLTAFLGFALAVPLAGVLLGVLKTGAGRVARPEPARPAPVRRAPVPRPRGPAEPRTSGIWTFAPGVSSEVMGVQRAEDGVWAFSKYGAARYRDGAPADPRTTLDDMLTVWKRRNGPVKDDKPQRFVIAAAVGAGEDVFAGGWEGQAAHGRLDGGAAVRPPGLGDYSRVDAMAWQEGTVYAAWRERLWSWREGAKSWTQPPGDPPTGVKALLAARGGALLAGAADGLWVRERGAWRRLWKGAAVEALGEDAKGLLLAGTRDGFVTVSAGGDASPRDLRGHHVTCFAEGADGRLWAGTWDGGLYLRADGAWHPFGFAYGLPSDEVTGLAVDAKGLLWVGLYGGGLVTAPEAEAARAALAGKAPQRLPGDLYDSLEDAARRRLAEGKPSGEAERLSLGGRDFVYFAGRQVAPAGQGCLGPDGTPARREGPSWLIGTPDRPTRSFPVGAAGFVNGCLLDRRGRLWVATNGEGVLLHDAGAWTAFAAGSGLDGVPVYDLEEDAQGRIWAAGSPALDRALGRYTRRSIHRFDGSTWTAVAPEAEGGGLAAFALRPLPGGAMGAATNSGFWVERRDGSARFYSQVDGFAAGAAERLAAAPDGTLALLPYRRGVTLYKDGRFRALSSRQGLFADDLMAAAFDADGGLWLVARDGRTFVAPLQPLWEAGK